MPPSFLPLSRPTKAVCSCPICCGTIVVQYRHFPWAGPANPRRRLARPTCANGPSCTPYFVTTSNERMGFDSLVAAARQVDPAIISVELPEQWYRVKVHGVPIKRYLSCGLGLAREEIELGTDYQLKRDPTWLRSPRELRGQKGSTIVITVGSLEEARKLLINGLAYRTGSSPLFPALWTSPSSPPPTPACRAHSNHEISHVPAVFA